MRSRSSRKYSSSRCSPENPYREAREALDRRQKEEERFRPTKQLIEIRDMVDRDIRLLRSSSEVLNKEQVTRLEKLEQERGRIQNAIQEEFGRQGQNYDD